MASKLYEILDSIENSRKKCVNVLSSKGIQLLSTTPLKSIPGYIDTYTSVDVAERTILDYGVLQSELTNDPDVVLPNTTSDYFYNEVYKKLNDKEIDGVKYVLLDMCIITNEHENSLLACKHATSINTIEQDNELLMYDIGNSSYLTTDDIRLCYETSDGAQYVFTKDKIEGVTHTWDASKDVIGPDGNKYRWVVCYYYRTNLTNFTRLMHNSRIAQSVYLYIMPWYSRASTKYVRDIVYNYIVPRHTELQVKLDQKGDTYRPYIYVLGPTDFYKISCIYDMAEVVRDVPILSNTYTAVSGIFPVACVIPDQLRGYIYLKCGYYQCNSVPMVAQTFLCNRLRYIEIDPDLQQLHSAVKYFVLSEHTRYQNISNYITDLTGTCNDNRGYAIVTKLPYNKHLIEFPLLQVINNVNKSTFNRLTSNILSLPLYTGPVPGTCYSDIKALSVPSATTFESYSVLSPSILYADLSGVTKIATTGYLCYNAGSSNYVSLRYLDLSSLTFVENTISSTFRFLYHLETLVLPKDFKMNLYLNDSGSLSLDCAKDLIDKCAQLEDNETYVMNFHSVISSSIPQEIKDIAINKGWTLN